VIKKLIRDESGNIESAMILIPLLFLFLSTIQIVSAIHIRNYDQSDVQSQASTRAISGSYAKTDLILNIPSNSGYEDQQILITSKRSDIPPLIPGLSKLLGGKLQSDVTGVAVIESQP
jgi:hypothetical protein